jgi:hypothetical protein
MRTDWPDPWMLPRQPEAQRSTQIPVRCSNDMQPQAALASGMSMVDVRGTWVWRHQRQTIQGALTRTALSPFTLSPDPRRLEGAV